MSPAQRLDSAGFLGLWLFAAVALLSIAAQNIAFVGMAAWLAARLLQGRGLPTVPRVLWPAGLFLGLSLAACWLSPNRAHSLETWRRWMLVFVAVYAADALSQPLRLRAVLGSLLFFGGLTCLGAVLWALRGPLGAVAEGQALMEVLGRWTEMGEWRAHSGSGGFMVLGTSSMVAGVFFSGLALEDARFRRPLALACLAAMGAALLLTFTRGAWLGALAGLALLLPLRRPKLALGAGAILLLLAAMPGSPVRDRLAQGLDMSRDSTRERVYMAQAGLAIAQDHPWFGVGDAMHSWDGQLGYYRRYMPAAAKQWESLRGKEQGHLHNNLVQVAAAYGLPALLSLLLLFAGLAWAAWRQRLAATPLARGCGIGLAAALLAWWVNGLFEYNFGSLQSSFVLWGLVGMSLAAWRPLEGGRAL
jgi:O-antigen ligase